MFSLSCWSWYCPGPGLLVWLKMEIEWQFSRLSPMERPCFGPLLNSDGNVYLSGEGELFFLDMMEVTCRCQLCARIQRKVIVYLTLVLFRRIDGWMNRDLPALGDLSDKALLFWKGEHCFWLWGIQGGLVACIETVFWIFYSLHLSSKIIRKKFRS